MTSAAFPNNRRLYIVSSIEWGFLPVYLRENGRLTVDNDFIPNDMPASQQLEIELGYPSGFVGFRVFPYATSQHPHNRFKLPGDKTVHPYIVSAVDINSFQGYRYYEVNGLSATLIDEIEDYLFNSNNRTQAAQNKMLHLGTYLVSFLRHLYDLN